MIKQRIKRILWIIAGGLLLASGLNYGVGTKSIDNHRPLLVVVTSDWCGLCKANHHYFTEDKFITYLKDKKIKMITVDCTRMTRAQKAQLMSMQHLWPGGVITLPAYFVVAVHESTPILLNSDLDNNELINQIGAVLDDTDNN